MRVAFEERPELTNGRCSRWSPSHPRRFQAVTDDRFAGGFDFTRANFPSVLQVGRVIGAVEVASQVPTQLAMAFTDIGGGVGEIQRFQLVQNRDASFANGGPFRLRPTSLSSQIFYRNPDAHPSSCCVVAGGCSADVTGVA